MSNTQVPNSPDALVKTWEWSRVPPPRAPEDYVSVPVRLYLHDRLAEVVEARAAEPERPACFPPPTVRDMIEVALWRYLEHLEDGGE